MGYKKIDEGCIKDGCRMNQGWVKHGKRIANW